MLINGLCTLKAHLHPRVITVGCFCFEMLYCLNAWSYWLSELKRFVQVSYATRAGGKEYSWSLIAFSLDSRSNKMGGFSYMKTVPRRAIHLGWMWAFNVCLLPLLTFKMVLMTWMLAQMKVFFSILYVEWRIRKTPKCFWMLTKSKNRYWIWVKRQCSFFGANECIFAQLVALLRKWMRIFS